MSSTASPPADTLSPTRRGSKRDRFASWPTLPDQDSEIALTLRRVLGLIHYERVQAAILDPSEWVCSVCETTKSLWICLVCGQFLCHERLDPNHQQLRRRQSRRVLQQQRRNSIASLDINDEAPVPMAIPPSLRRDDNDHGSPDDDEVPHTLTHLQAHVTNEAHPIFMELNTNEHQVYCFDTESIVEQDNIKGDIYLLRALLRQIQDLEVDSTSPSQRAPQRRRTDLRTAAARWHALRHSSSLTFHLAYFSPRARQRRERKDKLFTACFKWRHLLLLRCFHSWVEEVDQAREARVNTNVAQEQLVPGTPTRITTPRGRHGESALWPGKTGLRNLGNTCYLNSVVQALGHLAPFRAFMLAQGAASIATSIPSSPKSTSSLLYELRQVVEKLWSSKHAAFSPDTLVKTVWDCFPSLAGFKQQDSDELLRFVLSRFQETDDDAASSKRSSSINELFQGRVASEIRCVKCEHTSTTEQPFLGVLSVEIPLALRQEIDSTSSAQRTLRRRQSRASSMTACTLDDCLREVLTTEQLSGDAQYHCDRCARKQDATKRMSLAAAPSIVVVHINRTDWATMTGKPRKLQHVVLFPPEVRFTDGATTTRDNVHQLRAMIVHDGRSMTQGHYTCFAWHEELECWFHFNDHRVSVVSWEEVASQQAYLLFYVRQ